MAKTDAQELLRGSLEYAAAFDVEVWKAQQQTLFQSHISRAKKKLEAKIREELEKKNTSVVQQLEATRRELEMAAQHLSEAQREQAHKSQMLDAREAALEEQKNKLAARHEEQVSRLEDMCQRQRESFGVQVEALHTQLRDKDRTVALLHDRLKAAEESFERLRRRTARWSPTEPDVAGGEQRGGGDPASPAPRGAGEQGRSVLVEELQNATRRWEEATRLVQTQQERLQVLEKENAELKRLLSEREEQAARATKACFSLKEELNEREREYLAEKKRELEEKARSLEVHQVGAQLAANSWRPLNSSSPLYAALTHTRPVQIAERPGSVLSSDASRSDVVGAYARKAVSTYHPFNATTTGGNERIHTPSARGGGGAGVLELIEDLKRDVTLKIREQREGGARSKANDGLRKSRPSSTQPSNAQRGRGQAVRNHHTTAVPPDSSSDDGDEETLSDGLDLVNPSSIHEEATSLEESDEEGGSSPSEGSRLYLQSGRTPHSMPPLAPSTPSAPPSLAGIGSLREEPSTHPTPRALLPSTYPQPQDFVRAGASSSDTATTTHEEMILFVQQLKHNYQRLLETRVYAEDHPVLVEMKHKVELYEGYLRDYDSGRRGTSS